jgi:hypothetical protein
MSEAALALYEKACNVQAQRTEARRIRTRVRDARAGTTGAASRWPFELLQNVHDAGPRAGQKRVNVSFRWDGTTLLVEHNGTPFELQEVAALLSGGSSKEFESEETTGRFGTGFMVTHALACCIDVSIAINAEGQLELAEVSLDRQGDDEAILANIQASHEAIKLAVPLGTIDNIPTAQLRYRVDRPEAVAEGFDNLRRTLPYLFATCPKLGDVVVEEPERDEEWTAGPAVVKREADPHLSALHVKAIVSDGTALDDIQVYSCKASAQSRATLIALVRGGDNALRIEIPEQGFPRLFARFPVRDTGTRPIPVILDAPFDLPQERDRVLMSDSDKEMIEEGLSLLPQLVLYAIQANWLHAHRLAHVDQVAATEGASQIHEADWWNEHLSDTARALSELPIVKTTQRGMAPAVIGENSGLDYHVDFVLPRFSLTDSDGPSLDRLWPLVINAVGVDPPEKDIASEWNLIAASWGRLGVEVSFLGLAELADAVRGDVKTLDTLGVRGDPLLWIARVVDLIGAWSKSHSALHSKLVEGLLPDQTGRLRSAEGLSRDEGIDDELKDLVERIGPRVRSRLLHTGLAEVARANTLEALAHGLEHIVPRVLRPADLVSDAISHLEKHAPDGARVSEDVGTHLAGARGLLDYLWRHGGAANSDAARRLPLRARSGVVVRCSKASVMMGPVAEWPAEARPFAEAYPPQRVLDDLYAGVEGRDSLGAALAAWRLIFPSPLGEESPSDLKDQRLGSVAQNGQDLTGVSVSGVRFSQIALLSELIPSAGADPKHARALLGLVLCHIARADSAWRETQNVFGRRAGEEVPCSLRRALWLGDLLYRAWLPVKGENGKVISVTASAAAMKGLLEPLWLTGNEPAIEVLTTCFGFDPLELRIMATASDPETRAKVMEGLAAIVQVAGADPSAYAAVAEELAARKKSQKDVDRNRTLGLAIQEVVRKYMEDRGLKLKLIDHDYDYDVKLPDGDPLLDGAHRLEVGSWMMEVKATTSGDVRMTPAQAERASAEPDRYLLCVVDLRDLPDDDRRGPWTPEIVEPRARIFPQIGIAVAPTCDLVTEAVDSVVGIRNEKVLRYAVPPSVWEAGQPLKAWIDSLGHAGGAVD